MRCGSLGLLQWLQALRPGLPSFQCVRRFLPRVLRVSSLGNRHADVLLLLVTPPGARAALASPAQPHGSVVQIGAAARAQPAAVLPAVGRDRQLEQQRLAHVARAGRAAAHRETSCSRRARDPPRSPRRRSRSDRRTPRARPRPAGRTLEAADALEPGRRPEPAPHRDPLAGPLDPKSPRHARATRPAAAPARPASPLASSRLEPGASVAKSMTNPDMIHLRATRVAGTRGTVAHGLRTVQPPVQAAVARVPSVRSCNRPDARLLPGALLRHAGFSGPAPPPRRTASPRARRWPGCPRRGPSCGPCSRRRASGSCPRRACAGSVAPITSRRCGDRFVALEAGQHHRARGHVSRPGSLKNGLPWCSA